jgi:hypothetical protein
MLKARLTAMHSRVTHEAPELAVVLGYEDTSVWSAATTRGLLLSTSS